MSSPVHPRAAQSWRLIADQAAREPDPRRKANLELVARHVDAEVRGDLDDIMKTLVAEPVYHYLGASPSPGPQGGAAVRAYYAESVQMGRNRLEFAVDRVVAGDDAVVTEGVFRHAYAGQVLRGRGADAAAVPDPDGWYLVEYRALVVWPVTAEGVLSGEEVYIGEPPRIVRQLADDEEPQLGLVTRYRGAAGE
jgi:SnoaL-like domain